MLSSCHHPFFLRVSYFAWNVIAINIRFLQEHMEASFILCQRMTSYSVNKYIEVKFQLIILYLISFCCIFPVNCITYLLTKPSNPERLSSINPSSYIPSSDLNGNWRLIALLGNGGTTIYKLVIFLVAISWHYYLQSHASNRRKMLFWLSLPYCHAPIHSSAIRNHCIFF